MKATKFFSALALLFWISSGLQAQVSILLGPEIGIHNSKFNPTGDLDISENFQGASVTYSGIFAYQGGLTASILFAEKWGITTGIKYNRKGGTTTIETRDPNNPFLVTLPDGTQATDVGEIIETLTSNWLSIPILARAEFGNNFKVGLAIGPQINMGLGEYTSNIEYNLESVRLSDEEINGSFGESTTNLFKKSHLSLLILPYVSYAINPKSSLRFNVMFERGGDMVNENLVVGSANGNRNVNGTIKNSQFGVMLSYEYRFDLKVGTKY
jgi:hypothetical protein